VSGISITEAIEWSPIERVRNVILLNEHIEVEVLSLEPGQASPRHNHENGDQVFIVKSGEVQLEVEGEGAAVTLNADELGVALCPKMHQIINSSQNRAVVLGIKATTIS
jgi:quercetin dioxygenase-like cupin family protein